MKESFAPPPEQIDRKRHPLNNLDEINRILATGTDEEMETLRAFRGVTAEELHQERDRVRTEQREKKQNRLRIRQRELFGPPPTADEIEHGDFSEIVRLHSIDADEREEFKRRAERSHAYLSSEKDVEDILTSASAEAHSIVDGLSEEQINAVRNIQGLNMSPSSTREVTLVICGHKPSTTVHVETGRVNELRSRFEASGLLTDVREIPDIPQEKEILIATHQSTLERLRSTVATGGQDAEYGELMGYPKTAIEGVVNRQTLHTRPSQIHPDVMSGMVLSQAHWPEELAHMARWSYIIKYVNERISREARNG